MRTMINQSRAVFLDRDGVINKLIYHEEHGRIDTPISPREFELLPGVGESIEAMKELGYLVIVVSNQPMVGKGDISMRTFDLIRKKMHAELERLGVSIDGEAYCFHHPNASIKKYRRNCSCRKPRPGLILKDVGRHGIDLSQSYMIGDGLTDIQAGKAVGCKTILIGHWSSLLSELMHQKDATPDYVAWNLGEAVDYMRGDGSRHADIS